MNSNTKGILISASSCSGKSYLLRAASSAGFGDRLCVFEMDSLRYYHSFFVKKLLPEAQQYFDVWINDLEENDQLIELRQNLEGSSPEARLIKIKLVQLALQNKFFVTVLPQKLRHCDSGRRFIELLQEVLPITIVRIAVIPSNTRLLFNLIRRLRIWNIFYVLRARTERNSLVSAGNDFDYIVRNDFRGEAKDNFIQILKVILSSDR